MRPGTPTVAVNCSGGRIKKPLYRKPPRPVKTVTPDVVEERVRREKLNAVTMDGKITEALPNAMVTAELNNGLLVLGHSAERCASTTSEFCLGIAWWSSCRRMI